MKFYWFQWLFGKLFFPRRNSRSSQGAEIDSELMLQQSNQLAIVDETIVPYFGGRVRFQNSWWPALCLHHITLGPGEVVSVVGRHNITLLVEPIGASVQRGGND
ncbi:NfeD family protein [Laspinema sp. D1]|uniref:NfeD family protein n=1 Tax=Laspinema palackyanum D2a TaxID=2953684 RepID=A0ABT2MSD7_9CYAN|nr:NfeD family protein [Laspinema sp. D2b]MCT7967629.1 NfeD family protein [Laspinema sp. D2a]